LKVRRTDKKRQPRTFCPGLALFTEKWNNLMKISQGSKERRVELALKTTCFWPFSGVGEKKKGKAACTLPPLLLIHLIHITTIQRSPER
jgi:hypothetical protein